MLYYDGAEFLMMDWYELFRIQRELCHFYTLYATKPVIIIRFDLANQRTNASSNE